MCIPLTTPVMFSESYLRACLDCWRRINRRQRRRRAQRRATRIRNLLAKEV